MKAWPILDAVQQNDVETLVKAALAGGDERAAATAALRGYGTEVLSFILVMVKDRDLAEDVFSTFCEDIWRGLPNFRWESSLRTWLYAVARRAALRHLQQGYERRRRPLSGDILEVQAEVRTRTMTFLRTETKSAIQRLRAELHPDEQTLLTLRIDRNLSWNDIARIMLELDGPDDDVSIKREAAACRKRFERAKERLRALAREHGLLKERDI